ncbi:hypothetical protein SKAU_G00237060 [Synaphobranchus kaupii]|uniref:RNA helicase n=1 Tax=Synaphobranchus kaupii TaxID=118154 RepID=A0A9Q1F6Z5_SYNKA|nr:hypothetical protein SKAU_G00237060 [Synaphobranchus kaupii]
MDGGTRAIIYLCVFLFIGHKGIQFGGCAPTLNYGEGIFTIRHVSSGKCLQADIQGLRMAECGASPEEQWKWGSGHRLFHVDTAQCLGLKVHDKRLALFDCSFSEGSLSWRCDEQAIYVWPGKYLSVTEGKLGANHSQDRWVRDNTSESICNHPYQVVFTTSGNSLGAPCDFPFRYNGTWYHGCMPTDDGNSWCSTTEDFDTDRKFGYCLKYEEGCERLWKTSGERYCYQHNKLSAVSWQEARFSCLSMGGDLLSISSAEELDLVYSGDDPSQMWIGLNQLDMAQGWQWSDGSPLVFVNWNEGMTDLSILKESDCAVMTTNGFWEKVACDKKLPFICKKASNQTQPGPTSPWVLKTAKCEPGWRQWNGFCYKLVKEQPLSHWEAQQNCSKSSGALVSMHSLSDLEMIRDFHTDVGMEIWTGLWSQESPPLFQWTDKSPVSYTHWARDEPRVLNESKHTCVSYLGEFFLWKVSSCEKKLPFVCKKKGTDAESVDVGCPTDDEWRRHGNACYKVDAKKVLFKDRCDLTIMNRFEQAYINRLIRNQSKTQYFWVGLQDANSTGQYQWNNKEGPNDRLTFSNWAKNEPARPGQCAVMSSVDLLGQWRLRNCSLFSAGSVCKKEILPHVAPDPEPDPSLPCPPGWESTMGLHYCYKVFHEERLSRKRSWEEAERFCEALGAHLPSFSNEDEMEALHIILRGSISNDRYFWVGLNRRNPVTGNAWEWSDGRPVSSVILSEELQEDDDYNRDCVAFKTMKRSYFSFILMLHGYTLQHFYARHFHCDARLEWVCQILEARHHLLLNGITQLGTMSHQYSLMEMSSGLLHHYYSSFLGRCSSLSRDSTFPEREYSCDLPLSFVCEKVNITSVENKPLEPHPGGVPCGNDSLAFRDKCYTVFKPLYLPFEKANEHCQSLRGTLPVISSQAEQDFIMSVLPHNLHSKLWIGLRRKYEKPEWQWVDGSPITSHNFNALLHGQARFLPITFNLNFMFLFPLYKSLGDFDLCALMYNDPSAEIMGTWDYTSCSNEQNFSVCQHFADKPEIPKVPEGTFVVQNHTYKILQKNMTWFTALELCSEQDMNLASVSDGYQQAGLTVATSRVGAPLWIGLFSEDDGVHYRWTDHSHTVFTRWFSEPISGRCVYLDTDGFWKATECEEELAGAICHVPQVEKTLEDAAVKCPHRANGPGWTPFRNHCYAFHREASRWAAFEKGDSRETCKKLDPNAEVLTIRDAEENDFVRKQLLPLRDLVTFVWIGIFKDNETNQLKWYDGTNVQYSNWNEGRPNVTEKFMAGLTSSGSWQLFTSKHSFVRIKQISVVACKIDYDSKEEFSKYVSDFENYGSLRYKVIQRRLTWSDALRECGNTGSHLASAHDLAQDAHLQLMSKSDGFPLWVGLSSQDEDGSSFEWSDGTKLDYRPLGFSPSGSKGNCMLMNRTGSWVQTDCASMQEGAICYFDTTPSTTPSPGQSNDCPKTEGVSKWIHYKDHCYAFDMTLFNYSVYTMEEAKTICNNLDESSELLTIKDGDENIFVSKYIMENPLITKRVWLGLDTDAKGDSRWIDGTSVEFSKWENTSALLRTAPTCAVMISDGEGAWSRVSCTEIRSRVVCKAPAQVRGTPAALAFFFIVVIAFIAIVFLIVWRRNRARNSSTGILTEEDRDNITAERANHGNHNGTRLLLRRIAVKPPGWFSTFLEALKQCEHFDLIRELTGGTTTEDNEEGIAVEIEQPCALKDANELSENGNKLEEGLAEAVASFHLGEESMDDVDLYNADVEKTEEMNQQESPDETSEPGCGDEGAASEEPQDTDIVLRDYQMEVAIPALEGKNIIICLPTGSGKTRAAVYITKKHLDSRTQQGQPGKVAVLVNQVPLVEQHYSKEFGKYLKRHYRVERVSGDSQLKISFSEIVEKNDIIICTAQILENAFKQEKSDDDDEGVRISDFSLLVIDECHHTQKGEVYNYVMIRYLKQKMKNAQLRKEQKEPVPIPQILGLTASPGVGGARTAQRAEAHILKICANLDAFKIMQQSGKLGDIQNCPYKIIATAEERKEDPFGDVIKGIMNDIHVHADLCPSCDLGTQSYEQWAVQKEQNAAKEENQKVRVCAEHLRQYNEALHQSNTIRMCDAFNFLSKYHDQEVKKKKAPEEEEDIDPTETDIFLFNLFTVKKKKLQDLASKPEYENNGLSTLRASILREFTNRPEARGIIFTKTRRSAIALQQWIEENSKFDDAGVRASHLIGGGDQSVVKPMTSKEQRDVLTKFRTGEINLLIATTVAEEGLDIEKCNFVIRYALVTNEIAMIQARGRGRAEDSSYILVEVEGSGVAEREGVNEFREKMMSKAIKKVQSLDRKDYEWKVKELQMQAIMEERVRTRKKKQKVMQKEDPSRVNFSCRNCSEPVCNGENIEKIEGMHHVNMTDEFKELFIVRENTARQERLLDYEANETIACKGCGHTWGPMMLHRGIDCPCLNIKNFVVTYKDKPKTYNKWSELAIRFPAFDYCKHAYRIADNSEDDDD